MSVANPVANELVKAPCGSYIDVISRHCSGCLCSQHRGTKITTGHSTNATVNWTVPFLCRAWRLLDHFLARSLCLCDFCGLFSSIRLVSLLQESCRPGWQRYSSGWQGPAPSNQSDAEDLETEASDVFYWWMAVSINVSLGAHLRPRAGHLLWKDAERRRCSQIK